MKIFQESGIMKHIRPNDLILADRGFTVQHLLNHLQAEIKIPSFLKGRESEYSRGVRNKENSQSQNPC